MYPTWYYSFPTVLSGEKRKIMIKFSMFFHQPIEVNICTNSNKDWNSNSRKFITADKNNKTNKQIQKSIIWDTKCPQKCQKKLHYANHLLPRSTLHKMGLRTESLCKILKEDLNRIQHISDHSLSALGGQWVTWSNVIYVMKNSEEWELHYLTTIITYTCMLRKPTSLSQIPT